VTLQLEFEPEGVIEQVGDVLRLITHQVSSDLEEFKRFIEARPEASDGWRGDTSPRDADNRTLL